MGNINSGFNDQNIKTQMEAIQKSYENIAKALTEDFKSGMVDKVADYWACYEAVEFWKDVAKTVEKLVEESIFGTYEALFKTINSCAHTWAENTGKGGVWGMNEVRLKKANVRLDTGAIKENINNDRGINGKEVTSITSSAFEAALSTTKTALNTAKDAIDSTGFIDEQKAQMNGVKAGLDALYTGISDVITQLQNQLAESINQCITKYGDTATSVAGAYSA